MKSYILLSIISSISLLQFGCTSNNKVQETEQGTVTSSIMQVEAPDAIQQTGGELSKELVCMVNNTYMNKKQLAVPYEGKTYYGCCEMCVERIKTNKEVRYAVDPHTGKKVDKATAFITLNPASNDGSVLYFESEGTYTKYKATSRIN